MEATLQLEPEVLEDLGCSDDNEEPGDAAKGLLLGALLGSGMWGAIIALWRLV